MISQTVQELTCWQTNKHTNKRYWKHSISLRCRCAGSNDSTLNLQQGLPRRQFITGPP